MWVSDWSIDWLIGRLTRSLLLNYFLFFLDVLQHLCQTNQVTGSEVGMVRRHYDDRVLVGMATYLKHRGVMSGRKMYQRHLETGVAVIGTVAIGFTQRLLHALKTAGHQTLEYSVQMQHVAAVGKREVNPDLIIPHWLGVMMHEQWNDGSTLRDIDVSFRGKWTRKNINLRSDSILDHFFPDEISLLSKHFNTEDFRVLKNFKNRKVSNRAQGIKKDSNGSCFFTGVPFVCGNLDWTGHFFSPDHHLWCIRLGTRSEPGFRSELPV